MQVIMVESKSVVFVWSSLDERRADDSDKALTISSQHEKIRVYKKPLEWDIPNIRNII